MTARRLFVTLFTIALFVVAVRETLDPDMWWHLRTGEFILHHGIPRHDVFSFTVPTHEWVTHEWLSQVFMWFVYRAGGLPGLIVTFALLTALTFWLVYAVCAGRPFLAAFVVLQAALASAIVWGARPQLFNLLFTAAFVCIIERLKDGRLTPRALWLLPVLTLLWANFHSGYLLGIVLLGTYTVGEALQRWLTGKAESSVTDTLEYANIGRLALVTLASFLMAVVNPNGTELWIYPFSTLGSSAMQAYIQEWHSPDFHLTFFWPFGIMMAVGVLSWVFSQKRPTWSELLLFGGTAAAGMVSARNIPFFAIVAAPIIARHLLSSFADTRAYPLLSGSRVEPLPSKILTILHAFILILVLVGAGFWTAIKIEGNDVAIAKRFPVAAVDYLEQTNLVESPGYNSYNWGGYLIWRGVPVYVDGRADVYGDAFLFYYLQAFEVRENWREPLDGFSVNYVLMERGSPLTTLLAADDQWYEAYTDELAQVFVRATR